MECQNREKCMKLLQLIIDNEADINEQEAFEQKLKDCMDCYKSYHLEKAIKDTLRNKIEKKTVPVSLIQEIKNKIQETA